MTITALAMAALLSGQAPTKPTISYQNSAFVLTSATAKVTVPIRPEPVKAPPNVMFRRDQAFAVWDAARGITVRVGSYVYSTKLAEVAVTRKLFSPLQIRETSRLVVEGKRTREATALSGARRLGKDVYFLVRWDDSPQNRPWLEALMKVDLSEPRPKPQLLGRFDGLSMATRSLDDRLLVIGDTLGIVTRLGDSWGVARFEPASGTFTSQAIGQRLLSYASLTPRVIMFVEQTPHKTTLLGRADLGSGARRELYESRGSISILDKSSPVVALIKHEGRLTMHNVETGAQSQGLAGGDVRRTPLGLLHWAPADQPKTAMLLDVERLEVVSALDLEAKSAPAPPPSRSGGRPGSG
ncbi:MAG TPA: hypothetical protein VM328_00850 [Fimbriimonadaceae bacterium]|nr:hypothetical protein [Fimbriimonadaceae bacterium]